MPLLLYILNLRPIPPVVAKFQRVHILHLSVSLLPIVLVIILRIGIDSTLAVILSVPCPSCLVLKAAPWIPLLTRPEGRFQHVRHHGQRRYVLDHHLYVSGLFHGSSLPSLGVGTQSAVEPTFELIHPDDGLVVQLSPGSRLGLP